MARLQDLDPAAAAPHPNQPAAQGLWISAVLACAAPSLLAFNVSPSPTFLNQALAFVLWAAFVLASANAWHHRSAPGQPAAMAVLLLLVGAAAWSWLARGLPASLALSAIFTLAAAALLLVAGQGAARQIDGERLFAAFAWGWLIAGLLNVVVALIQVFAPSLPDGGWIAASTIVGRAVGNLRQPNHLSSLLLWSCISAVALLELRRLSLRAASLALVLIVFAVVLSASRTGLVSVLLLALWGLFDRRLSRGARALLLAAPLLYALSWQAMAWWAQATELSFGGAARVAEADLSGSRFGIWRDTWALVQAQPWAGVGFGEFNFAWTLSVFPGRPVAFFDHTHNLPLQLIVELGLPLAALVMGLLLWALTRASLAAWRASGDAGTAQRSAVLMVLMIGLHSLLEYPLWYAYFLLPTAWALGFALRGLDHAETSPAPSARLQWAAMALIAGALFSVWDYQRVAVIFSSTPGAPSLEQRIASGQRSLFFAHHADYAAVTSGIALSDPARAFDRTSHYLLDSRLMMAWARSLAANGQTDAARHIAARLREFRKTDAEDFFLGCPDAAQAAAPGLPFQCELPARVLSWQDFLPPR